MGFVRFVVNAGFVIWYLIILVAIIVGGGDSYMWAGGIIFAAISAGVHALLLYLFRDRTVDELKKLRQELAKRELESKLERLSVSENVTKQ
jgi:hypothetical protein